jgi:hypothetical protein
MARYFDLHSTVLVVVGHGILPEEEDRPIAYELKSVINAKAGGAQERSGVVVTDLWILNTELAEFFPAIALGGPAVNAFTADIYEDLPVTFTRDRQVFVQMRPEDKRAAVWGMDQAATREAVDVFVKEGMLERFLELIWRR